MNHNIKSSILLIVIGTFLLGVIYYGASKAEVSPKYKETHVTVPSYARECYERATEIQIKRREESKKKAISESVEELKSVLEQIEDVVNKGEISISFDFIKYEEGIALHLKSMGFYVSRSTIIEKEEGIEVIPFTVFWSWDVFQ